MKKQYLILTYIFLIFIFSIFYFSLNNKGIYNTEDLIGKKINDVELKLFEKGTIKINQISNYNYTLINFWASWCGPWRQEHKNLMILSKLKNLKIIGVNFKDEEKNAKKFLEEMGNPFFILAKDEQGKKSVEFGVYGIPETILINKDLVILKKYIGPLNRKEVAKIKQIIER